MRRVMLCTVVAAGALWAVGCGGSKGSGNGSGASAQTGGAAGGAAATTASGPTGNATVSGVIHFTGTAPANPKIDMSQESACAAKHPTPPTEPQYVVASGKLGNVFVYVKSGLPADAKYSPPDAAVEIDQDGCLYRPRVFGVEVNQKILIKNNDPVLHNIKAVPKENRGFNISQPSAGMQTTRTFTTPEVMVPLECNVHGWMHAWVGVLPHPFFATSGTDGSFSIKNLPAGTYTIEAWHEKLGTQTQTVTVGAGETKTADFTFSGPKA
jgi:Carboxypeptidase regulatory-like domain